MDRRWIIGRVRYIIFEGKTIDIWKDPWLNSRSLTEAIERELILWGPPQSTKLSVLIQNGKWTKPHRWTAALDTLWDEIQHLEIGGSGEDILIWPLSHSGLSLTRMHGRPDAPLRQCLLRRIGYGTPLSPSDTVFALGSSSLINSQR
ncbi:hypothetical protein QJS04_geneDACA007013 [Acorus gramineus]|uniref:Uncharacterized protein n=1 Tax=Acorus gramineus TaxID=55184 RepID=A0AAV9A2J4_ACOGR|nr:hypothetical protein QJS04_geneDACA007013 [Acorus gramineus]